MRKFLLKISLFISIFSGIYLLFFYLVQEGIRKSDYQDFAQWNEIYSGQINSDVIIMGSSRAWRQVDPQIIDEKLDCNSYNLGIDGYHIPMQLTKYEIYLESNRLPERMIYIVDHFSFDKREDLFNKIQFAPYFNDTILTKRLKSYEGYKWQHYNTPYFQYSGSKEVALAGLTESLGLKDFKSNKFKGFRSKDQSWENDFDVERELNPEGKRAKVKAEVVNEFQLFLEEQKKLGVEVVVVYSPDYIGFQDYIINRDSVMQIYEGITQKLDIDFIDFSTHYLSQEKDYFYNPTHLNSKGAEIFTNELTSMIESE